MHRLAQINNRLDPFRTQLLQHPIYARLDNIDALRTFMEHHIFAVWDFMSLLKVLQRKLTHVDTPWLPTSNALGCRLINEIVLGEESDEGRTGGYASHFQLYRNAMLTSGANTQPIDNVIEQLRAGTSLPDAIQSDTVPRAAQRFVQQTFDVIQTGDLCAIASTFLFGREDLLPGLFQKIVDRLNTHTGGTLDEFQYYLERHIEVDGEQHGPMAQRLMESLCEDDDTKWQTAEQAAVSALEERIALWDGALTTLEAANHQRQTA